MIIGETEMVSRQMRSHSGSPGNSSVKPSGRGMNQNNSSLSILRQHGIGGKTPLKL